MENRNNKTSMRATLKALPVGGSCTIHFGVNTYTSIRNTACILGLEMGRQYSVHLDRAARTYQVIRTI